MEQILMSKKGVENIARVIFIFLAITIIILVLMVYASQALSETGFVANIRDSIIRKY